MTKAPPVPRQGCAILTTEPGRCAALMEDKEDAEGALSKLGHLSSAKELCRYSISVALYSSPCRPRSGRSVVSIAMSKRGDGDANAQPE